MPQFFPNPPSAALHSTHHHLAQTLGKATKYPTDVAPFGAIADTTPEAYRDLHTLLQPNEIIYIPDAPPTNAPGLIWNGDIPCLQFAYPTNAPIFDTPAGPTISPLTCADAATMLALTDIAFPGLFRIRTCEMGNYFGIWQEGQLIAMCGERMNIKDFRELSGLCTHPDHRGQGHAARLLAHLIQHNRDIGLNSYLHVAANNHNAIALYKRLGFILSGELLFYRITRTAQSHPQK
jgi:GNAT superfamily N-acetyltransferase